MEVHFHLVVLVLGGILVLNSNLITVHSASEGDWVEVQAVVEILEKARSHHLCYSEEEMS